MTTQVSSITAGALFEGEGAIAMKLTLLTRSLLASLLLLASAPVVFAQEPGEAAAPAGYEKIDLNAKVAIPPKPAPAPLDSASSAEKRDFQERLKKWREIEKAAREERNTRRKDSEAMVRGDASKPKAMDTYFSYIHFPLMTSNFKELQRDRKYVLGELAQASPNMRSELFKLATDWSKKLIEGNYAPGTRVNATLLLGELNDVDAKSPTPATPHRAALKYLLDLLDNQAISPEVKGAALVGILRHVELDAIAAAGQKMPPADMDAVVTKMIALASTKDAPPEIAKPVFTFMQRRAATILGAYGQPGADGKVYNALIAIVGNDAAPLWVRCDAAMSLGRLNYTDAKVSKEDAVKGAKSLGALAAFAANDELETLKKLNESGGAIGGMGGPPGGYGAPGGGKTGGPPGGAGGPPGGMRGGPPGGMGGVGGIGGVGGGGSVPGEGLGGAGGVGGLAGGNSVYYPEQHVDAMVRRLMAALNSALIGLDGANGKNSGLRKPKQDVTLDRIAENIEKLRAQLVRLQKKDDEQGVVFRDFRLAVLDMETVSGVKKKASSDAAAKPVEPTTPPAGGATGGQ